MQQTKLNSANETTASSLMKEIVNLTIDKTLESSDLAFADFFYRRYRERSTPLISAVIWLSYALKHGHTSLNLQLFCKNPGLFQSSDTFFNLLDKIPIVNNWEKELESFCAVGGPISPNNEPLVLENGYLYFRRFFMYENEMASIIKQRSKKPFKLNSDIELLKKRFNEWFDDSVGGVWQKLACLNALGKNFSVITGGPGTGKTFTVLRLMAIMLEAGLDGRNAIALAAPTGKAAARVGESILSGLSSLELSSQIKNQIPVKAQTIHRLLGYRYQSNKFKYNRDNPLPYSVVIIDEASMIDLTLMTKLLEAIDDKTKLILLGDKDQLASVEAGSVFADICSGFEINSFENDFISATKELDIEIPNAIDIKSPTLNNCIVQLQESRRFGINSGIGKLASAINNGNSEEVIDLLKSDKYRDELILIPQSQQNLDSLINNYSYSQFISYTDESISDAHKLKIMGEFQFLCAHKKGANSVHSINKRLEIKLGIKPNSNGWYHGQPIIMMENDYDVNVYNGDTALVQVDDDGNYSCVMDSYDEKEGIKTTRVIPVIRLKNTETSWALSVHKSQGSEYDSVVLVLPENISPVLTRELLYTGITRAKNKVYIIGSESVIMTAVEQKTKRLGGLRKKLWGDE